jgi:hypothetical protein
MNDLFKWKVEFEEVRLSSDGVLVCHGKLNDGVGPSYVAFLVKSDIKPKE